jgi:hypothetical protein
MMSFVTEKVIHRKFPCAAPEWSKLLRLYLAKGRQVFRLKRLIAAQGDQPVHLKGDGP